MMLMVRPTHHLLWLILCLTHQHHPCWALMMKMNNMTLMKFVAQFLLHRLDESYSFISQLHKHLFLCTNYFHLAQYLLSLSIQGTATYLEEGTGDLSDNSTDEQSHPPASNGDAGSATSSPASVVAEEEPAPPVVVVNLHRRRIEVETEAEKRARIDP